ncbi:hypothetical protein [Candidatus Thiosymbion oneisti]|uniref:hypothetical protein n=1 Tax=Candidatus Thiosymbion oneisti TaxID=589554 RepID=UPI00114CC50C|nr:hypothetical protein [Candidatus Thiosymbion oneisti]
MKQKGRHAVPNTHFVGHGAIWAVGSISGSAVRAFAQPTNLNGAFRAPKHTPMPQGNYLLSIYLSFGCPAVFPEVALDFIRATQAKTWDKLEVLHGDKTGERVAAVTGQIDPKEMAA